MPDHLKNASSALAKDLGHGKGYLYPHDHPAGFVTQGTCQKKFKAAYYGRLRVIQKSSRLANSKRQYGENKYGY